MSDIKRRQVLKTLGAGAIAIPVTSLIGALPSRAQEMVDPESSQAQALQYVENSDNPDQNCANCTLYQGEDGSDAGGCSLFPGQQVSSSGWCSAWVAQG